MGAKSAAGDSGYYSKRRMKELMLNTPHRPPRLPCVFESYPLYFVTFCTLDRRCILACEQAQDGFRAYACDGDAHGIGVGHYVLMPDHIHLFVRLSAEQKLGCWVKGLKRATINPAIK